MHAIKVLTVSTPTHTFQVQLPPEAVVVEQEGRRMLRVSPGPGFEGFADDDGLIEIAAEEILPFAERGDCGMAILRKLPIEGGEQDASQAQPRQEAGIPTP